MLWTIVFRYRTPFDPGSQSDILWFGRSDLKSVRSTAASAVTQSLLIRSHCRLA